MNLIAVQAFRKYLMKALSKVNANYLDSLQLHLQMGNTWASLQMNELLALTDRLTSLCGQSVRQMRTQRGS